MRRTSTRRSLISKRHDHKQIELKMPLSIEKMVAQMHALRARIEGGVVAQASVELAAIFAKAEIALARRQELFNSLLTYPDGKLQNIPENIDAANLIIKELHEDIGKFIVGPGKEWADDLARLNLDVAFLSPEQIKSAFDLVLPAEKGVLKTGYQDTYRIMGVVGDDVESWFRRTMMDLVIEEIPLVNKLNPSADTLMSRLIESGRIKPIKIKTNSGKFITRSVRQRAEAIARIESGKIINRTHEALAADVLGDDAVYRNPHDSRTTPICRHASQAGLKTLAQWSASRFGRPPRLNPFHLCRSVLIGGMAEWFEDIPEKQFVDLPKQTNAP